MRNITCRIIKFDRLLKNGRNIAGLQSGLVQSFKTDLFPTSRFVIPLLHTSTRYDMKLLVKL